MENNSSNQPLLAPPAPVSKADRLFTIDMIRGFALLGILMMNIPGFGIDRSQFASILQGSPLNADFKMSAFILIYPEGTMRGLFSMLFGAGMVLFTLNKTEKPGGVTVAEYYYRRLLWLVLFGVFNAYVLLWEGDILYFYGLAGMLLYPFRKAAPKWLIAIGFLCFFINVYKNQLWWNETREKRHDYLEAKAAEKRKEKLNEKQQAAISAWTEMENNRKPDSARIKENVSKMRSGYGTIFTYFIPRNADGETWWMYHGIWDFAGMMFVGMGLFYLGFFSNKLATSTYLMILIVGYGVGLTAGYINFYEGQVKDIASLSAYVDAWRWPHWHLYDLRRLFVSTGHAALLILVYRSGLVNWLMKALANVGQMAFSNYLMQSIICTWYFYGYGFGNYNHLRFYQLYYVVLAVWVFQLIFSSIWLKYFQFGPFEWLWRSLTYWKKQPMLKVAS
ncbi:MAG TPA: DUF418 domain-containing protein [Phnomibacter sp.]|nr:DUF418 domain-containing protein [Phnomibacter sp.]